MPSFITNQLLTTLETKLKTFVVLTLKKLYKCYKKNLPNNLFQLMAIDMNKRWGCLLWVQKNCMYVDIDAFDAIHQEHR